MISQPEGGRDFELFESDFRAHFDATYGEQGANWDEYCDAYRFGFELGEEQGISESRWDKIESQARQQWEQKGSQLSWDQVHGAIREGWNQCHGETMSPKTTGRSKSLSG